MVKTALTHSKQARFELAILPLATSRFFFQIGWCAGRVRWPCGL